MATTCAKQGDHQRGKINIITSFFKQSAFRTFDTPPIWLIHKVVTQIFINFYRVVVERGGQILDFLINHHFRSRSKIRRRSGTDHGLRVKTGQPISYYFICRSKLYPVVGNRHSRIYRKAVRIASMGECDRFLFCRNGFRSCFRFGLILFQIAGKTTDCRFQLFWIFLIVSDLFQTNGHCVKTLHDFRAAGIHPFQHFFGCITFDKRFPVGGHLFLCPLTDGFIIFPKRLNIFDVAFNRLACSKIGFNSATGLNQKLRGDLGLAGNRDMFRCPRPIVSLILLDDGALLRFRDFLSNDMGRHNELERQNQHQVGRALLPKRKRIILAGTFPARFFPFIRLHCDSPHRYVIFRSFCSAKQFPEVKFQFDIHCAPPLFSVPSSSGFKVIS